MLGTGTHKLVLTPQALFTPHTIHAYPVGHNFSLHLLVLSVFDQSLVFTSAALAEAAEAEDEDGEKGDTADDADDDVLCGLGKAVPFLGHGLRVGVTAVLAVEGDGFGVTGND